MLCLLQVDAEKYSVVTFSLHCIVFINLTTADCIIFVDCILSSIKVSHISVSFVSSHTICIVNVIYVKAYHNIVF
jgi:hypothetical protein